ncbi:helix-turn-helix domain-containing protein [Butyrivibrio sp. INlla14]|uniref:helix-turn-helix domain-containing protein n=1 Tax=Butyrivibrio sp. INlla14 TaxID=1520808 RepID=UPI00087622AB|nr:XRE family transcriptional regulator [Butyrivibrio sp. INlla14]SCY10794.1 hypothetical protein SAMN02910371_01090 [Butyrivibrio sp. INlla14]
MSDFEIIGIDGIADGMLIEKTDMKKMDSDRRKRLTADAFIRIRKEAGMNKKEFSEWLGVPYRTMEDWELASTQVPEYVLRLIAYKVMWEKERGNL